MSTLKQIRICFKKLLRIKEILDSCLPTVKRCQVGQHFLGFDIHSFIIDTYKQPIDKGKTKLSEQPRENSNSSQKVQSSSLNNCI